MKGSLTERQAKVLRFIRDYLGEYGYPPTQQEIANALGIEWIRAVEKHLKALEKKGYIKKEKGARTIQVLHYGKGTSIPLLGTIAAGNPILAEENIERFIILDETIVPKGGTFFLLRVEGESMKDAGILPHDLVLVRSQNLAEKGEIVAFLIEDEVTIKYFFPQQERIMLKPANPEYQPIVVKEGTQATILGKVVAVVRLY